MKLPMAESSIIFVSSVGLQRCYKQDVLPMDQLVLSVVGRDNSGLPTTAVLANLLDVRERSLGFKTGQHSLWRYESIEGLRLRDSRNLARSAVVLRALEVRVVLAWLGPELLHVRQG